MKKKIYISSTFRDLKDYRHNAMEALRFLIDSFSLVRVMEYMMPGSKQPILSECLNDVKDCDIYILIIGKQYGTIAEGTGLSFTENEYHSAKANGKTIILLIADKDADNLRDEQTDNQEAFDKFKNLVTSNHLQFSKNFASPDHLVSQLLLALYPLTERKWVLGDNIKLRCDRRSQFLDFISYKYTNQLNTFIILSKHRDKPRYFIDRIATYEFGYTKEYLQYPMKTNVIIGTLDDYDLQKKRFLAHITEDFIEKNDALPLTMQDCLLKIKEKGLKSLFIQFHLDEKDVKDKRTLKSIRRLWLEFNDACINTKFRAFFVFILNFPNSIEIDSDVIKNLKSKFITPLEQLNLINESDVDSWLRQHITTNIGPINKILKSLFSEKSEYDMGEFYDKIDEINNILN